MFRGVEMTLLDYLEIASLLGLGAGLWQIYGWGVALTVVSGIILTVSLISRFRTIDRQGSNYQDSS